MRQLLICLSLITLALAKPRFVNDGQKISSFSTSPRIGKNSFSFGTIYDSGKATPRQRLSYVTPSVDNVRHVTPPSIDVPNFSRPSTSDSPSKTVFIPPFPVVGSRTQTFSTPSIEIVKSQELQYNGYENDFTDNGPPVEEPSQDDDPPVEEPSQEDSAVSRAPFEPFTPHPNQEGLTSRPLQTPDTLPIQRDEGTSYATPLTPSEESYKDEDTNNGPSTDALIDSKSYRGPQSFEGLTTQTYDDTPKSGQAPNSQLSTEESTSFPANDVGHSDGPVTQTYEDNQREKQYSLEDPSASYNPAPETPIDNNSYTTQPQFEGQTSQSYDETPQSSTSSYIPPVQAYNTKPAAQESYQETPNADQIQNLEDPTSSFGHEIQSNLQQYNAQGQDTANDYNTQAEEEVPTTQTHEEDIASGPPPQGLPTYATNPFVGHTQSYEGIPRSNQFPVSQQSSSYSPGILSDVQKYTAPSQEVAIGFNSQTVQEVPETHTHQENPNSQASLYSPPIPTNAERYTSPAPALPVYTTQPAFVGRTTESYDEIPRSTHFPPITSNIAEYNAPAQVGPVGSNVYTPQQTYVGTERTLQYPNDQSTLSYTPAPIRVLPIQDARARSLQFPNSQQLNLPYNPHRYTAPAQAIASQLETTPSYQETERYTTPAQIAASPIQTTPSYQETQRYTTSAQTIASQIQTTPSYHVAPRFFNPPSISLQAPTVGPNVQQSATPYSQSIYHETRAYDAQVPQVTPFIGLSPSFKDQFITPLLAPSYNLADYFRSREATTPRVAIPHFLYTSPPPTVDRIRQQQVPQNVNQRFVYTEAPTQFNRHYQTTQNIQGFAANSYPARK